jgi:hypothetical protein
MAAHQNTLNFLLSIDPLSRMQGRPATLLCIMPSLSISPSLRIQDEYLYEHVWYGHNGIKHHLGRCHISNLEPFNG